MSKSIIDQMKRYLEAMPSPDEARSKFMIRNGQTKRIRFITDMTDAIPVTMHSSWEELFPTPCESHFGVDCLYCGKRDYHTARWWALTVLDRGKLKVLAGGPSAWGPLPQIMKRFDEYGTITDRAYKIEKRVKGQSVSWSVTPERGKAAWKQQYTPFTAKEVYEVLYAAGGAKVTNGRSRRGGKAGLKYP